MLSIQEQLIGGFVVSQCALAHHLPITHQEGKRHISSIQPQLRPAAGANRMPEASIGGSWISFEALPYLLCSAPVFFVRSFPIEHEKQVPRQHVVQSS